MSLLDEWDHMDGHMMDFNWTQDIWVFVIFGVIIFVTLIIVLLYFLKHSTNSIVEEKEVHSEKIQRDPVQKTIQVSYCPECGSKIGDENAQYCSFCGKRI